MTPSCRGRRHSCATTSGEATGDAIVPIQYINSVVGAGVLLCPIYLIHISNPHGAPLGRTGNNGGTLVLGRSYFRTSNSPVDDAKPQSSAQDGSKKHSGSRFPAIEVRILRRVVIGLGFLAGDLSPHNLRHQVPVLL